MADILVQLADKNGGVGEPEMRIPPLFVGSVFVPVGLLCVFWSRTSIFGRIYSFLPTSWFGWSAQAKIHWIMPVIGSGTIFGLS
jgi:hypothetical protein